MANDIEPLALNPRAQSAIRPEHVIVVIPTLNEAGHVADCIGSLLDTDAFAAATRVVVADGGSTDGTREIVSGLAEKYADLRLLDNPGRLQSAGLNIAVAEAAQPDCRFIVRCDAHAVYPQGYVRRIVETLVAQPQAASVTTVLDAEGSTCFARGAAFIVDTPFGSGGSAHRGGQRSGWVDHAHHAGFRLDWFRRIGGYDPSFSQNEDAEYDVRLAQAGGRIWLAADLRLAYHVRPTASGLIRQYWNYGRGRARTVLKHRIRLRIRQVLPVLNLLAIVVCLAVGLVWPWAFVIPALYVLCLAMLSVWAAWAMRSLCGVFAGPALAIIHNAWGAGLLREITRRRQMDL